MARILIAEDDKSINKLVSTYLKADGHEVVSCFDGLEAYKEVKSGSFDAVVTDVMMPEMDGFELATKIRETDESIPIIFLTALSDKPSVRLGFKIGADDYVVKPFDADELVLRVNARLRQTRAKNTSLTVGNLTLDTEEHTAYLDGEELALTVREFDLLLKFLSYPKKTFTRSALMDELWGFDSSATSRSVDVYITKLREKTAKCNGFEIVTVHGLGYKAVLK